MTSHINPVIFAGAGPGDPELITVKSAKALENADLIIYAGSLVPEAVLCWKGPNTRAISSAELNLDQIMDEILRAVESGQKVVRLHTGDPALYGAIFEQIRRLQEHDIPYKVLPGVTAAFAASASIGMEYTLPEMTQTLILTRLAGRTPVPETESLEKLAAHGSSMAIYLSIGMAGELEKILTTHYGGDSICAIAYKVSHPEEKIIYTPIKELESRCESEGITRHALIIVGRAVAASIQEIQLIDSKLYDAGFSHGYRKADANAPK